MSKGLKIEITVGQVDNGYAVHYRRMRGWETEEERNTVHESLDDALAAIRRAVSATENALLLPLPQEVKPQVEAEVSL